MCIHYQALKEQDKYSKYFDAEPPIDPGKWDLWPRYVGGFQTILPTTTV